MITKETCLKIWNCYQQIERCESLIADMSKKLKENKNKTEPTFQNCFGDNVGLSLRIPKDTGSSDILGVDAFLGVKIAEKHIKKMYKKLKKYMKVAELELKDKS